MADEEYETITLAFELKALERLVNPSGVIRDTQRWTSHLGIVSDEPTHLVRKRARDYGFNPDFLPGPREKPASLVKIKNQPEHHADRYILVSVDEAIRDAAERAGWEYRKLEEAAETAGWQLATEPEEENKGDDERTGWP